MYCIISEYSGEEAYNIRSNNKSVTFLFGYRFLSNSTTLYEEYWVYDGISTIGSVGGTLGMCIGFSFTGLFSYLINILQHVLFHFKSKLSNRNFLKQKPQNGSLTNTLEIENKIKQNEVPHVEVNSRKQIYNERYLRKQIEIILEEILDEKIDKKLEEKFVKY